MSDAKDQKTVPVGSRAGGKKPYEKPAFRFESVFETRALSCGKVHARQASCKHARKNS